ncbi:uncharacterized protein A4U43_C04F29160 [Asparagus officinalis]|uniref:DNA repair metallo-beta-lactamase domain-containing protein n=1 Tax=Asparagus officinalis TaxID=4686 RepID=A0A5P1F779_ASPOF|nr:5' exonuclease Apollo [Asparagus officinalis]ONK73267.1 uncharacterized protein A4U43_C04F29160 [Asparagus officinalis]
MPIEIPRGLPFSVDTWTPQSNLKRHRFLTHAHKDHLSGIAANSSYPIYATRITKSIVLQNFPQVEEAVFVEIEVGASVTVRDPDGDFTVSAFDANHCPGAVMFLFEGEFGNILHTGDCRLTPDYLQHLPMKYIAKKGEENLCNLDYLFLDCTFSRCSLKIPSKQAAVQQVINCIWKHPDAPVVYLACDMLGQEEILVQVSKTFGSKIYVDDTSNPECFHALSLVAPEILSSDASSRFQVIEGFPRLNERASQKLAEAQANLQPSPLFLRPSSQWYAHNNQPETTQTGKPELLEAIRDEFGIYHVCYSMHSSRDELEWALQLLKPKWVISTTPPCRAMELDYVKKYCYKTRIATDDPLWKLFGVSKGKSVSSSSAIAFEAENVTVSSIVEDSTVSVAPDHLQLEEVSAKHSEIKSELSTLAGSRNVTLFGRARFGIPDIELLQDKKSEPAGVENNGIITDHVSTVQEGDISESCSQKLVKAVDLKKNICVKSFQRPESAEHSIDKSIEANSGKEISCAGSSRTSVCDSTSTNPVKVVDADGEFSRMGSSKDLNISLKKLYRSMNVPVPRPLPSLVDLLSSSKRVKLRSEPISDRLEYCYSSSYSLHERVDF